MADKPLTGKIDPQRIVMRDIPRPLAGGHRSVPGAHGSCGNGVRAMYELGIDAAIPAAVLNPMLPGARMVGPAVTVRNIRQSEPPTLGAMERRSKQADLEAHNLAGPGDVIVIEGAVDVSSLGGNSCTLGHRQGEAGAIIDGADRRCAGECWRRGDRQRQRAVHRAARAQS